MRHSIFLSLYLLTYFLGSSQDYVQVKVSKDDSKQGILYHYQKNATDGHYMVFDLFLYKNGRFHYSRTDNLLPEFSVGSWKIQGSKLILHSTIQEDSVPVNVSYIPVDSNGRRRIAPIRNLKEPLGEAFVFVNTDSVSCFLGDAICNTSLSTIYRLKVGFEHSSLKSNWIDIKPGTETIQLVVDTDLDLSKYVPINKVFTRKRNKLIE
jgi:hypothetical protein